MQELLSVKNLEARGASNVALASSGAASPGQTGPGDVSCSCEVQPQIYPPPPCRCPPLPIPVPPPEDCTVDNMALYQDKNLDGQFSDNELLGILRPFEGKANAVANYGYRSASAHPVKGPQPEAFKSKVFLYKNGTASHLTFFNGVDADLGKKGSPHNKVSWDILVAGNGGKDKIELSDDNLEIQQARNIGNELDIAKRYLANWEYWYNTDGGVIGPIFDRNMSSTIKIDMNKLGDIKTIEFVSANGAPISIPNEGKKLSFMIKMSQPIAYLDAQQTKGASATDATTDSVVISSPLRCSEPQPVVTVKLNPVTKVEEISYPSKDGMLCPALMRLNDFLVSGTSAATIDMKAGSQLSVKFSELYRSCADKAKKALSAKMPLIIKGKVFNESVITAPDSMIQFSTVDSCEIETPGKAQ